MAAPILTLGCAAPLPVPFDENQARYATQQGDNDISGTATIISKGEYSRTCQDVFLLPATAYWRAWAQEVFGNAAYAPRLKIQQLAADKRAWSSARHADCDSVGHFHFSKVADGKYYVFSEIVWLLRWQQNGGGLLRALDVRNGTALTVSLMQDWRAPQGD